MSSRIGNFRLPVGSLMQDHKDSVGSLRLEARKYRKDVHHIAQCALHRQFGFLPSSAAPCGCPGGTISPGRYAAAGTGPRRPTQLCATLQKKRSPPDRLVGLGQERVSSGTQLQCLDFLRGMIASMSPRARGNSASTIFSRRAVGNTKSLRRSSAGRASISTRPSWTR